MTARARPRRPRAPRPPPRARRSEGLSRPLAWRAQAYAVFGAQVLALVRDRRALFAAFALPLLLYPLFLLGGSWLARISRETLEARKVRVALDLTEVPAELATRLEEKLAEQAPLETETLRSARLADAWDWKLAAADNQRARMLADGYLRSGADLVLLALAAERPGQWALVCWYDGAGDLGNEARTRVLAAARALAEELARERRAELFDADPAAGLELESIDVASAADTSGARLGRWLPLLAVFVLLLGASHAALAAFAGEREAGTLETLLAQPVAASAAVLGKLGAVLLAGLVALLLNAGSVIACLGLGIGALPGAGAGAVAGAEAVANGADHALALDAGRVLLAALCFLPAAALLAALLCLACARAKSFREGQLLLLPLVLGAALPTLPALGGGIELDALLAAVPLTGPALAVRDVLRGSASAPLVAWMALASTAWAALAIGILARALDAERLVQHGENEDEAHLRRARSRAALQTAVAVVFAVYFVGGWWQSLHAVWGLAATLWVLLPLATWHSARLSARRAGTSIRAVLQLRAPRVAHALGAVLLAPAAAQATALVFRWQAEVFPMPHAFAETAVPPELTQLGTVASFALLALSPAVCEELYFRGALLGGLRGEMSKLRIVLWQALLFGAVHAAVVRFAPSALFGALLACVALRTRSLWPAVLLHATFNGLVLASADVPGLLDPALAPPAIAAGLAGALLLAFPARRETAASP